MKRQPMVMVVKAHANGSPRYPWTVTLKCGHKTVARGMIGGRAPYRIECAQCAPINVGGDNVVPIRPSVVIA